MIENKFLDKQRGTGDDFCTGNAVCSHPVSMMKRQGEKMILVLLCVIFAVSAFMTVTASAATAGQDGVEAELVFSKTEYKAGENLDATLTVTNRNPYPVHNVQTKIVLPEGIKLASGSLPSKAFTLAANETRTHEATLIREAVQDTPNKGSDQGTTLNSSKTAKTAKTAEIAKTGDDSEAGFFIVLMLLSGGVLVFAIVRRKRLRGKGVIPFMLCFIVLGAVMLPMTADAAAKQKEFTVGQTVKVDGKEVIVKAVISYDHLVHSSVVVKNGTLDNGTGTGIYAEGETVKITADPAPEGQHFSGWTVLSGGAVLTDSTQVSTTFEMTANEVEITANYEVNVYTIEAAAGEGGEIDPKGSVDVTHGKDKTFTITPKTGYHIEDVKVDGESKGVITEHTFVKVTKVHTIEAVFAIDTFEIKASAGEGGKIDPSSATVNYGSNQKFEITADTGYHIEDVKVDGESKGAITMHTFENVTKTHTIEAVFAKDTFKITTKAGENGSITPASPTVSYGEQPKFTITADTGYRIKDVKVDGVSKGAVTEYTFEPVIKAHTIEAVFEITTFEIKVIAGEGGKIDPSSATVKYGDDQTFKITADTGYHIEDVKVDGESMGAINNHTLKNVTKTHTIEAVFAKDTFKITTKAGENGSITPASPTVSYGEQPKFTITADTGYRIKDVKVDGESMGAITEYISEPVTKAYTIEAVFEVATFEIEASAGEGGKIDPPSATVKYGDDQKFEITADTGYHIEDVKVDEVSQGAITEYTFDNVTKAHTIKAIFAKDTFTITTEVGEGGGQISPESSTVDYGDNEKFIIKPELGYSITEVKVDDEIIDNVAPDYYTYEFTNIKESHTISATFKISTRDELKKAVRGELDRGQTDIVIAGNLSPEHQNAAGEALREWCAPEESRQGTISLTLSDVEQVSGNAFVGAGVKRLNLPQATTIGQEAFKGQEYLESITVPKVETVGNEAFRGCGMKNVELPEATTLEGSAFLYCGNLESVTAPKVTTVHYYALSYCWNLTSLTFKSDMASWGGGVLDDETAKNITLTLASDQKVLSGGDNGSQFSIWKPDGNGDIVEFGLGKTFCGYEFKEIKKAE